MPGAGRRLTVISQLPPPHHGSTLMTKVWMQTMASEGFELRLVDRRFSKEVGQVGETSLRKILAAPGLLFRLSRSLLRKRPAACVFFMTNRPASFLVDWAASEILRVLRVPVIGYIHTSGYSELASRGRVWNILVSRLLSSASSVVCLSPALEADVAAFRPGGRTVSIGNTSPDLPPAAASDAGDRRQVLYFSNLIPEKGIETFTELATRLSPGHSAVNFLAAGAPVSDTQIDALRQSSRGIVDFVGKVGAEEKWKQLEKTRLLAFPSSYRYEAQPLVILEAMSMGVPVVAFRVGGLEDIVIDGVTGRLIEPGDVDTFTAAVQEIIESDELASRLGGNARRAYAENYSHDAFKEAWTNELSR
jgi:glycosyltransferase involved in cell wall biosynthesis